VTLFNRIETCSSSIYTDSVNKNYAANNPGCINTFTTMFAPNDSQTTKNIEERTGGCLGERTQKCVKQFLKFRDISFQLRQRNIEYLLLSKTQRFQIANSYALLSPMLISFLFYQR